MAESETKMRICEACGGDCSGQPRIKDAKGRYLHKTCYEKALAKAKTRKRAQVEVASPVKTKPPKPAPEFAEDEAYGLESEGLGDDFFSGIPTAAVGTPCPDCGSGAPEGAVLCTVCGHNFQTGKSAGKIKVSNETALGNATKASAKTSAAWTLALIGSSIGGAVGAAAWAIVAVLLNAEIGYIAVGVGILSGLGAAMGAGSRAGAITGLVASGVAILAIFVGKFAAASIEIDTVVSEVLNSVEARKHDPNTPWFTDDEAIRESVTFESYRRVQAGERLTWPMGMDWDTAYEIEHFPAALVQRTRNEWAGLTESERSARKDALMRDNMAASIAAQIAVERMELGESLAWPAGKSYDTAFMIDDFPSAIASDARSRWDAMPRAEQVSYANTLIETRIAMLETPEVTAALMAAGYGTRDLLFDALWIVLAVVAAFGTGSSGMAALKEQPA